MILSKDKKKFVSAYDNRYLCGICSTPVEVKIKPGKSTYTYSIYCPTCDFVLKKCYANKKDDMFAEALSKKLIKVKESS